MNKNSIVVKMFLVTFAVFLGFVIIDIVIQRTVFEEYYIKNKLDMYQETLERFSDRYSNQEDVKKTHKLMVNRYVSKNNIPVVVFKADRSVVEGEICGVDSYTIIFEKEDGTIIEGHLSNYQLKKEDLIDMKIGESYFFKYILQEENKAKLLFASQNGNEIFNINKENKEVDLAEGKLVYFKKPMYEDTLVDCQKNSVIRDYYLLLENGSIDEDSDKVLRYNIQDEDGKLKEVVMLKKVKLKNGEINYIAIGIKLNMVDETLDIITSYYSYMIIIAIALIFITSYIYTRMIAYPLIDLNEVTMSMKNLDFSKKSKVKSQDELGSLAENLNMLGENFQNRVQNLNQIKQNEVEEFKKEIESQRAHRKLILQVVEEVRKTLSDIKKYVVKTNCCDINNEMENIDNLMEEVISVYNMEEEDCILEKEVFDIAELYLDVRDDYKNKLEEKGINTMYNMNHVNVFADREKIKKIFESIMEISLVRAGLEKQINVEIKEEKNEMKFKLETYGKKLSKYELDNIWNAYHRLNIFKEYPDKRRYIGILYIKNVLTMHGCKYGVRNTENGVEFYFTLKKVN